MIKMIKIYFLGLTKINEGIYETDNNKRLRFFGTAFAGLFLIGFMMVMYWNQLYDLLEVLQEFEMVPQLISLGVGAVLVMSLFFSFSQSVGIIFLSVDLSFWFSTPMSKFQIFFGKSMIAYTFQIILSLFLMIPPLWFVGQYLNAGISFYILGILGTLVLPIPFFILGILLGTLVHFLLKGRSLRKSLIATIIGILAIGAFVVASFLVDEEFFSNFLTQIMEYISMSRWLQIGTQHFIELVLEPNVLRTIFYFVVHLLLLGSFILVTSHFYQQLLSLFKPVHVSKSMANATFKNQSPLMTLYKREFKRYLSSNVYMINTGLFIVILIVVSIFLAFNSDRSMDFLFMLEQSTGIVGMGMTPIVIVIASLTSLANTTSASISLEGKNFSKLKSFPVNVMTIFWSKICVSLSLSFAGLIVALPVAFQIFPFTVAEMLLSIGVVVGYCVGSAVLGLMINLKFPKLDWDNESVPVKQSLATIINLIGNAVIVIGPIILSLRFLDLQGIALLVNLAIFVAVLNVVVITLLYTFGAKWFEKADE